MLATVTEAAPARRRRPGGAAFLLAQVGALGARLFAERVAPLGLTAAQSGVLRLIAGSGSPNQAELADALGVRPSRLVVLLDELEGAGLVRRDPHPGDRRQRLIVLTERGRAATDRLVEAASDHEDHLCRALSREERRQLRELLAKVAADHHLIPGVHPGYAGTSGPVEGAEVSR
jgi:DNA-binding MarR family transcriptional regulator